MRKAGRPDKLDCCASPTSGSMLTYSMDHPFMGVRQWSTTIGMMKLLDLFFPSLFASLHL